ncbi:MAG: ATP-binding protein [Elusimicrobiota bacterium]
MTIGLPSRLSWKLLAAIIPVVILAVSVIVWLQYSLARKEILRAVNKEVHSLAERLAANIDDLVEQRYRDMLSLAETPLIADYYRNVDFGLAEEAKVYKKDLNAFFQRFAARNPGYAEIVYLDKKGRLVSRYSSHMEAARDDYSGEEYFTKTKGKASSDWWISPMVTHQGVGPVIYYAKAITDAHEEFKGALVLCYDLAQVRTLLTSVIVGRHGQAYLDVENGGRIGGGEGSQGDLEVLRVSSALIKRPWTVGLEAPLEDFLGPLRSVRNAALLTSLLGMGGLIAVILLVVRSLTRPISEMVIAAGKVGEGDFSHRISAGRGELGALGRAFNEMGERLEENRRQNNVLQSQLIQAEKLSAVGQLISAVAHELNNPLGAISGYVQIALQDSCPPQMRSDLGHVYTNVLRCRKVVENLLFFVRQSQRERKRVELNDTVSSALELLDYRLTKTENVKVMKMLAAPSPVIVGDFQQIVQVLINLLNNACDAMETTVRYPEGKHVTISTKIQGDRALLRVEDNGPGIKAEVEGKVFAAFFTTKQAGRGTGLGLPICKQIIDDHGGKIILENRVGQGCAFVLDFPLGSAAELKQLEEQANETAEDGCAPIPGKKILVVDDEKDLADLVARLMREDGDEVVVAYGAKEALSLLEAGAYDLVISDVELEQGKGSDIFAKLQERGAGNKVLFMTGDILNAKVLGFLSQTRSPYVVKPFDIAELRQAARRLLARGV